MGCRSMTAMSTATSPHRARLVAAAVDMFNFIKKINMSIKRSKIKKFISTIL